MGRCALKADIGDSVKSVDVRDFEALGVLGKGGFGEVRKVRQRATGKIFAMKQMLKSVVVEKKSIANILSERRLLEILTHPLISNLHYAFQDQQNLYLVIDFFPGRDLRYHMTREQTFSEVQISNCYAEFLMACLLSSLEHIHKAGVLHRDVKPENLILDEHGYLHLIDFGTARVWVPNNARDTSGTPGYMAPEVLCHQDHGITADYFAVGVLCYELMTGTRPYSGDSRKEIRRNVLAKQVRLEKTDTLDYSNEALDFVNCLLRRRPEVRLGTNGTAEVMQHPWLADVQWEKMEMKSVEAPYVPRKEDIDRELEKCGSEGKEEAKLIGSEQSFPGYHYE